jgi:hypothetical protein
MSQVRGPRSEEGGVGDEVVGWEGKWAFRCAGAAGNVSMRAQ